MSIVDDVLVDDERAHAFAKLRAGSSHARVLDEQAEYVDDVLDEGVRNVYAGVVGYVEPGVREVPLCQWGQPVRMLG